MAAPNGNRRVRVHGSPWAGIEDACASAAKQFADPVAMEGIQAAATAHYAIKALGDALCQVGQTSVDTIAIDPRVAAYMERLGEYVLKAVEPTAEVGAAITKAHQPKIDRIVEDDPRERKWDLSAHDGARHTGARRFGGRRGA